MRPTHGRPLPLLALGLAATLSACAADESEVQLAVGADSLGLTVAGAIDYLKLEVSGDETTTKVFPSPQFLEDGLEIVPFRPAPTSRNLVFSVRGVGRSGTLGSGRTSVAVAPGRRTSATVALFEPGHPGSLPATTLVASPAAYDFGTAELSQPTGLAEFTIRNQGAIASGPLRVAAASDGAGQPFVVQNPGCVFWQVLAPGESCPFTVGVNGHVEGPILAPLTIVDGEGAAVSIALSGTIVVGRGDLSADRSLDFGPVAAGTRRDLALSVRTSLPVGSQTGPLGSQLTGDGAAAFAILADGCTGQPLAGGGDPCVVQVRFTPTAQTHQQASLLITDTAGVAVVNLEGIGVAP
jgi:hypothetical protein